ncbi:hypothetical protein BcepSauron_039 [Burkholderia phage BcepSauron]|uniref:Uncharacterized protein n=1 Tax=Burkholderia phage BcepSauron TaxID=2530033 RepID=A0A482ML95_9CAUD|nr:hypothetical protein H1O17_gp039 [Burkholderia phage BcepSauron]QBQ74419.1 hypothetical protein BcepSauron_039 [Burkholderia phage BcepSauron]
MAKQVRETAAGRSISAWVILNRRGVHVATIHAHYADSGTVTVDVFHTSDDATFRSMRAVGGLKKGETFVYGKPEHARSFDAMQCQQGRAGGGGYDKVVAAMRGMVIDGVTLYDHSSRNPSTERMLASYLKVHRALTAQGADDARMREFHAEWRDKADKLGMQFANWAGDRQTGHYTSLYTVGGIDRLSKLGYQVIRAI